MTTSKKASLRAAALAASVLLFGVTACSSSDGDKGSNGGDNGSIEAVDDGTTLKMWTRAPLERQAINAVEAYNSSHQNQIELEILPNDDVEGMVGSAAQTDSLPDILAGDVVRIPYWTERGIFTDLTEQINNLDVLKDE